MLETNETQLEFIRFEEARMRDATDDKERSCATFAAYVTGISDTERWYNDFVFYHSLVGEIDRATEVVAESDYYDADLARESNIVVIHTRGIGQPEHYMVPFGQNIIQRPRYCGKAELVDPDTAVKNFKQESGYKPDDIIKFSYLKKKPQKK